MTTINEILSLVSEQSTETFKESYLCTGYFNSGRSFDSIKPLDNKIVAHIAVLTLVFGRGPSAKYPPWGYIKGTETPTDLMRWCMDIFASSAKEARGASFVIARKIKEEGNRVHRGLTPPIPTDATIEKANEVMFNTVLGEYKKLIKI